jgi:hypothetical protein
MTLNRRKFLQGAGTLALGSMVFSGRAASFFDNPARLHPVGLQLFTFFGIIDDDPKVP